MYTLKCLFVVLCLASTLALSVAQLTFTSSWGKRGNALFDQQQDPVPCKTPTEILVEIFRFVQNEGQRFIECGPKG
uniref:Adipokinetic hormone 1 n=1 Tax=Megaselia scalaris TaxID=36166 RepID=T1H5C7_MEGSC